MVSEKGWCDKIGYGTDTIWSKWEGAVDYVYTNKISTDTAVGDPVYDAPGGNIIGNITWVNFDDRTAISYEDTNGESYAGYIYGSVNGPIDSTPYFKVPKLSSYIIQKENIPVIGNGNSVGLNYGSNGTDLGLIWINVTSSHQLSMANNTVGKPAGVGSSTGIYDEGPNQLPLGVSTDPTKSGMITDLSNDSFTGRVMIQLFNSTTDTAVATCNQVLADVSALNQGDYVIYYDSADITDHSHAYPNANTLTNNQWYRIYKSGWVEQGGEVPYDNSSSTSKKVMNITLPIIMSNTNYYVNAIFNGFNKSQSYYCSLDNCSNNSITIMNNTYTSNDFYCFGCRWEVKGFSNITN